MKGGKMGSVTQTHTWIIIYRLLLCYLVLILTVFNPEERKNYFKKCAKSVLLTLSKICESLMLCSLTKKTKRQ